MNILLIEDDADDVELLQEGFHTYHIPFEMRVISDGSEAVEFVRSCTSPPQIIVLDFNLPRVHGREILKEIKASPLLKRVPLVVLTTSSSKEDMNYAYELGACQFLIKPVTSEGLKQTVEAIVEAHGEKNKKVEGSHKGNR